MDYKLDDNSQMPPGPSNAKNRTRASVETSKDDEIARLLNTSMPDSDKDSDFNPKLSGTRYFLSYATFSSPTIKLVSPAVKHLPAKQCANEKGKIMRKRCKVCYNIGRRKESTFYCRDCSGQPRLCVHSCFGNYHK
ncbi:hypothetical protein ANN_26245 [Periplaneta americana]|uniref:PiggyBac transposable element-derived protein 4 C-terminal zinc-finger domain-containing protein n=1 Tax=Periplaneta americana TaxID=6978 RepID=A0ABQ8S5U0_PERAM|nr:hypothetical protein ANN_26245 [Periplaneta americana]